MGKLNEIATAIFGKSIVEEDLEVTAEILEIESEREKVRPSMVHSCEDPSIVESVYTLNQQSYLIDAEQFV